MIQTNIRKLVQYGIITGLVQEEDKIYTTNRLLELFELDELTDMDEEAKAQVRAVTVEAVSYTHLTLPTMAVV